MESQCKAVCVNVGGSQDALRRALVSSLFPIVRLERLDPLDCPVSPAASVSSLLKDSDDEENPKGEKEKEHKEHEDGKVLDMEEEGDHPCSLPDPPGCTRNYWGVEYGPKTITETVQQYFNQLIDSVPGQVAADTRSG